MAHFSLFLHDAFLTEMCHAAIKINNLTYYRHPVSPDLHGRNFSYENANLETIWILTRFTWFYLTEMMLLVHALDIWFMCLNQSVLAYGPTKILTFLFFLGWPKLYFAVSEPVSIRLWFNYIYMLVDCTVYFPFLFVI